MTPAIKIENLSKQYRLGLVGTGTLIDDINRWWHLIRGKEDPYLQIGDTNDRTSKGNSDYIWALKNINIEIPQGEVLGIIGKNGAGKSTLLKILSKVTGPTTGSITYKGRIGSLLEVGTGFNPELTGCENIYLNGAILGMRKREIDRKLDEIIDFSGCERYIDTPVKRYSSGMTVRLGFAVAAFLEPEILVVDEVLAVGDAEFQKKAIGKMQNISKQEGRTVLFVSHNLNSILQLCNNTILFDKGLLKTYDKTKVVIEKYLSDSENNNFHRIGSRNIIFTKYELLQDSVSLSEDLTVNLSLKCNEIVDKIDISLDIRNENFEFVAHVNNHDALFYIDQIIKNKDNLDIQVIVKNINLAPGLYYISLWMGDNYNNWFDYIENCLKFRVYQGTQLIKRPFAYDSRSKVVLESTWNIES
jgi:lipopolysaccharide transport system ATP-binding protein